MNTPFWSVIIEVGRGVIKVARCQIFAPNKTAPASTSKNAAFLLFQQKNEHFTSPPP